ncbi:15040_t:CDS:2 [Entrophospora sp. SA101]|nr:4663_t:CDS:2 [Entrophospora sp. SA101]CAJ0768826.1 15040_t:CDS:2 [Entrophospora sp. SA101]CAJ0826866.1 7156_t:CDS:2 [Entrophospora sp. SA101]CAJ0830759.1 12505_t:CDS:2 [Entrophospora sp. SA101]
MSKEFNFEENPHRRFNPLTNSWVLCSPQRAKRPWLGQVESSTLEILPSYDPKCYLCPGNSRAQGDHNPNYSNTFLFDNDFSAVESISPDYETEVSDKFSWLLRTQSVKGQCKVMCFSPNHNVTLAEMSQEEISKVVETWIEIYQGLSSIPHINYIQIFENKGAIMGCSNPHPHCQIWSTDSIPCEPTKEFESMTNYFEKYQTCLLCDYILVEEVKGKIRVVYENNSFVCLTPYWSAWPFETMIISKFHLRNFNDFSKHDGNSLIKDFSNILRIITCKYDNLFRCSFPYSMGIHQSQTDNDGKTHICDSHFHVHFYPPLRSAAIKKFMVAYADPLRDITPEQAAERLRNCSEIHYKVQKKK